MAKYHLNEKGEPGLCRARTRPCPLGSSEEHFSSVKAAQAHFEESQKELLVQSIKATVSRPSAAGEQALTSSLSYNGPVPAWHQALEEESMATFGSKPKIIDRIDSPAGPLLVSWEEDSLGQSDKFIQLERGLHIHRVTFRSEKTGEILGRLSTGYLSDASVARSWKNDEWTGLRYCDEFEASHVGFDHTENFHDPKTFPIEQATTSEELLEAKRKVWAAAHTGLKLHPENFDMGQLTWGSLVNLKPAHAPEDEVQLDRDLKRIQGEANSRLETFKKNHKDPGIDYAELESPLRGTGMGPGLYVYAARKLAEKHLTLSASGLQTNEAQKTWLRMAADDKLPVSIKTESYFYPDGGEERSHKLVMDFREAA